MDYFYETYLSAKVPYLQVAALRSFGIWIYLNRKPFEENIFLSKWALTLTRFSSKAFSLACCRWSSKASLRFSFSSPLEWWATFLRPFSLNGSPADFFPDLAKFLAFSFLPSSWATSSDRPFCFPTRPLLLLFFFVILNYKDDGSVASLEFFLWKLTGFESDQHVFDTFKHFPNKVCFCRCLIDLNDPAFLDVVAKATFWQRGVVGEPRPRFTSFGL